MSLLRCLVVDDEELARGLLENYIARMPNLQLVASCKQPLEAAGYLQQQIDIVFLDIQMPEMTGLEWIRTMPRKPQIILTTAYPQYAIESYQLEVTDYLLKPFRFERFMQAVQKAAEWKRLQALEAAPVPHAAPAAEAATKDYLMVKADHKLVKIRFEDLLYVQSKGEYVQYHSTQGKVLALESLRHLEEVLPASRFIRVHKSWIVALDAIEALEGNMIYVKGETIPVGASYKDAVKEAL